MSYGLWYVGEHSTMYQIIVTTGNKSFAGTDANVYIQLHGRKGQETPRLPLDDEKNNFEKGQIDVFKVYRRNCLFVTPVKLCNSYSNSYFVAFLRFTNCSLNV